MPRKTKEAKNEEKVKKVSTTSKVAKVQAKPVKSSTSKSKAKTTTKTARRPKKTTTKPKASNTKKTVIVKETTAKKTYSPEYYDLPFKYNKTVVTILAQTPTNIFVYWEISDKDRENLKKRFGKYFFEITKPVLIVHNITKNYSFEIDINDFANSWYVNVNDSNSEYQIELGRRPIEVNYSYIPEYDKEKNGPIEPLTVPYIYISSSNDLVVPNDHVLFNWTNKVYFKNVKTSEIVEKHIKDFPRINGYGKIIDVDIYELYKNEFEENYLKNPSSRKS